MEIRSLRPGDDRSRFSSGDAALDRFFREFAGQDQFRHQYSATYVAVEGTGEIIAYATIAMAHINGDELGTVLRKRTPSYPLPILRLARLAVSSAHRSKGVGAKLLKHVGLLALQFATAHGCVGILVDAKKEAVGFYQHHGFVSLEGEVVEGGAEGRPQTAPMFLSLRQLKAGRA